MTKLITALLAVFSLTASAQTVHILNGAEVYYPNGNSAFKAGDTLKTVNPSYNGVEFRNIKGTREKPIVWVTGNMTTPYVRIKGDCQYLKIIGKGLKCNGFVIEVSNNIYAEDVESYNAGIGLFIRCVPDTADKKTLYPNYSMPNLTFKRFYIHNITGECVYAGSTSPNGNTYAGTFQIPIRLDSVTIDGFIVDSCGWDGIQLSCARNGAKITNCKVTRFGTTNMGSQRAGIILGANTNGEVSNNYVANGTGNGIQGFGYGVIKIFGNTLENCGTTAGEQSILTRDDLSSVESNPPQTVQIYGNIIKNPNTTANAVKVFNEFNNALPATVKDNSINVTNPPSGWQAVVVNVPNSTVTNNVINGAVPTVDNSKVTLSGTVTNRTLSFPFTITATGISKREFQFSKDGVTWETTGALKPVTVATNTGTLPYGTNLSTIYVRLVVTTTGGQLISSVVKL